MATKSTAASPSAELAIQLGETKEMRITARAGKSEPEVGEKVRFGVITALSKEFAAMSAMLDNPRPLEVENDPNDYAIGTVPAADGSGTHTVVVTLLKKMGNNSAAAAATNLLRSFPSVQDVLMVGIAGGIPAPEDADKHVRLGDIMVSDEYGVIQYDHVKISGKRVEHRGVPIPTSARLLGKVRRLEAGRISGHRPWEKHIRRGRHLEASRRPDATSDRLFAAKEPAKQIPHPHDPHRRQRQPKVHCGRIGSANLLLKNAAYRDRLRDELGIRAVEMEGSGIADSTWAAQQGFIIIRGICDYGDPYKNDVWQGYAAVAAAAYARALIETFSAWGDDRSPGSFSPDAPDIAAGKAAITKRGGWNAPLDNPFFTGREEALRQLRNDLLRCGRVAVQGLAGVGKTQLAIRYAHLNRDNYAAVFWVSADTDEALLNGSLRIARILDLPEAQVRDQSSLVQAVRRWLEENAGWLLVLDNADELNLVRDLLPTGNQGHILVTTRATTAGGIAHPLPLEKMLPEVGATLLLRRARLLEGEAMLDDAGPETREAAIAVVREVDGLPLAIDQAGAFIEEVPSTPAEYLRLYLDRGKELRGRRGELGEKDHASVTITFSLAFERLLKDNPAAADLLRACAFLAPDAIPEEVLTAGGQMLGDALAATTEDQLALAEVLCAATRFSLLRRHPAVRTLTIHRLVQDVLRDGMSDNEWRTWVERTTKAVNLTFPTPSVDNWPVCERLLPHARVCGQWIERLAIPSTEGAHLLNETAVYLWQRGLYAEAEPLYARSLALYELALGPESTMLATAYNNLGALYMEVGRYQDAGTVIRQGLEIREKRLPPDHVDIATSLNNLATVLRAAGNYRDALGLYDRAIRIKAKALGWTHPDVARLMCNLAFLYRSCRDYDKSEQLYRLALPRLEAAYGQSHPELATAMNNLAELLCELERYEEAEPLCRRALEIKKDTLGPEHPDVGYSLNALAQIYWQQGDLQKSESLLREALRLTERFLGNEHPDVARGIGNLALILKSLGRDQEADCMFQSAIERLKRGIGEWHPDLAKIIVAHAELLRGLGRETDAAALERQAAEILIRHANVNFGP